MYRHIAVELCLTAKGMTSFGEQSRGILVLGIIRTVTEHIVGDNTMYHPAIPFVPVSTILEYNPTSVI